MTKAEEIFLQHRPLFCEKCGGKMFYQGSGLYQCRDCGAEQMDDFGKIKEYLEQNEGTSAVTISKETGVELAVVGMFLKDGRIQIPSGSKLFIKCERCGCSLQFGRFCQECTMNLAGQLKGAFYENMGEKPQVRKMQNGGARMRYLDSQA
mgnify:CR=1 FL=1